MGFFMNFKCGNCGFEEREVFVSPTNVLLGCPECNKIYIIKKSATMASTVIPCPSRHKNKLRIYTFEDLDNKLKEKKKLECFICKKETLSFEINKDVKI
ncbi:Uncharacterised protein [uncultured archaeon]|nr:Uncharacterised protein [uncultured archaeon]